MNKSDARDLKIMELLTPLVSEMSSAGRISFVMGILDCTLQCYREVGMPMEKLKLLKEVLLEKIEAQFDKTISPAAEMEA
jgi:hypothetical protein